jgi:hypothetical protein
MGRHHSACTGYTQPSSLTAPSQTAAEAIYRLVSMMQAVDASVVEHGVRTAHYSLALGDALGLLQPDLWFLHVAGRLHDIGKMTLPQALLQKDGPYTAEEYAIVQCHPRAGAELLSGIPFLATPALWIAHHHERWDGSGYPYGLRNVQIPLGSRILAVADLFDSLASTVSETSPASAATAMLGRAAGSQLDPMLVEEFLRLVKPRERGFQDDGDQLSNGSGQAVPPALGGRPVFLPGPRPTRLYEPAGLRRREESERSSTMKIQPCPRCREHTLVPTGAFWACTVCQYAITHSALLVEHHGTRSHSETGHAKSARPGRS